MAKTGNPNGDRDPEWPAVSNENDAYLEIGAKCDFWDSTPMLWPHIWRTGDLSVRDHSRPGGTNTKSGDVRAPMATKFRIAPK
jgi:hypothetical protein